MASSIDGKGANGTSKTGIPSRLFSLESPSLEDFKILCEQSLPAHNYPLCSRTVANIPIYNMPDFSSDDSAQMESLQDEWNHILQSGPGVFILKRCFLDTSLIDRVNTVFEAIIDSETEPSDAASVSPSITTQHKSKIKGDHFATEGANSRVWNSYQKHAERDPSSFVAYYSNPWLAAAASSWLGPSYSMTAQVNVVRPGGKPQIAHRDYHLGLQTADSCARFPAAMQVASQLLTLQGAVAHSDMPANSGPTRLLPFSQQYAPGYMAYRLPHFTEYFNKHWVSAPLQKGDAVFFNPALFHAAGENLTKEVVRSANLLQISSAFGKPMETVDTARVMESCFDVMRKMMHAGGGGVDGFNDEDGTRRGWKNELRAIVETVSNGYPFPTNLDARPPAPGGMAPSSETDILTTALERDWDKERFMEAIRQHRQDSAAA